MNKFPALCLLVVSCAHAKGPDLEREKQKILAVESLQRKYHLAKDATSFVNLFSDHFLSMSNGRVDSPSRRESIKRFDQYFQKVQFVKWDDSKSPVIRFSDDGTIAYVVVQKRVITRQADSREVDSQDTTDFAWLTVYKNTESGWKIDCVVSTNK